MSAGSGGIVTENSGRDPKNRGRHSRRWRAAVVTAGVLAVALAAASCSGARKHNNGTPTASPSGSPVQGGVGGVRLNSWKPNAAPNAWNSATNQILYNVKGDDGLWDGYAANPDGSDAHCLTCSEPNLPGAGTATQRGISDVSPDGKYMLVDVEKGDHDGKVGMTGAEPGKGVYSDVWLMTADGKQAWPLVTVASSRNVGTIWPRFNRDGKQITWSQMYKSVDLRHPLGSWTLNTGTIQWDGDTPTLVDRHSFGDGLGKFFEPYAFSSNNDKVLFASDLTVKGSLFNPSVFNSQIYTMSADLSGTATQVTPKESASRVFADYNEFAFYVPGTDRIIVARSKASSNHGLDYWSLTESGGGLKQVTDLNANAYAVVGGLAFDPHNPSRFIAGVASDPTAKSIHAVMVTNVNLKG
jgi:hypothetical protein